MKQYKWLLLDADNTLFDFDAAEDHALTQTMVHFGVPVSDEAKRCYSAVNDSLWKAFERGEIPQEAIQAQRFTLFLNAMGIAGDGIAWNQHYVQSLAGCSFLLTGAEELCCLLSAQYTLALITNGLAQVQRRRLEGSPIAPYFAGRVFISGEMGCRKPEKSYFDAVLTSIGAAAHPDQALVVGDSLSSDIRGACSAGLDSLWLNRSGARPGPDLPTYEVHSLAELGQLLTPLSTLLRK